MGSDAPKMAAPAFWSASKKQKAFLLQVTEHRLFHVTRQLQPALNLYRKPDRRIRGVQTEHSVGMDSAHRS
jgi:hypothetical protein